MIQDRRKTIASCLAAGALMLAILAGCTRPNRAPVAEGSAETTRAAFDAATAAFHQALRANDADAAFAYVAEDVVLMPPGEPPVRGKAAMRDWYARLLAQYRTASLTLSGREVFLRDGWAMDQGSFEWGLTPVGGGTTVVDRGGYIQVWKSLGDGQWRFEREVWNSTVPAVPESK